MVPAGVVELYDSVNLQNDGVFDFTGSATVATGNNADNFTNTAKGTVEQTAAGSSSITTTFNNQIGLISATAGSLTLGTGTSTGGTYNAAAGATVAFSGHLVGTYTGSGAGTVTVGGNVLIGGAGATFNFPGTLFQWTGNYINLDGDTLTNAGSMTWNLNLPGSTTSFGLIGNTGINSDGYSNQGGTFDNTGTITMPAGTLQLYDGIAFTNDKTLNLTGDAGIATASFSPSVTNTVTGTVEKTGGTGTSSITSTFNNQGGVLTASTGTLSLGRGTDTGGTFNASANATVAFQGYLTGTYTGSGAGLVTLSGNVLIGGVGATFNFPTGLFAWTQYAINLDGDTLINAGSMTWLLNTTTANAYDLIGNTGIDVNGYSGQGGTLDNRGTISLPAGNVRLYDNVEIENEKTLNFSGDASISYDNYSPVVVNTATGTVSKTGGTGVSNITATFDNQGGTVSATTGTLSLVNDAGDGIGYNTGGTYNPAAGATIAISGHLTGTYATTLTGSAGTVTLGGNVLIGGQGAAWNFPAGMLQVTADAINLDGDTLTNTGFLTWTGGTLVGNTGYSINGYSGQGGTLDNKGTITVPSGSPALYDSVQIENEGTLNFAGDSNLAYGSYNPFVTNAATGLVEKTGGAGTSVIGSGISFNSNGGVATASVGTLNLSTGTSTGGAFNAAAGASLLFAGYLTGTYTGTGAGTLGFGGNVLIQSAGATFNFAAGLLQWSANDLNLDGDTLTNAGSITWSGGRLVGNTGIATNGYSGQGGTLDNTGTLLAPSGSLGLFDNVLLENQGTVNFTGDASFSSGSYSPTVTNTGLLEKTGGTATSTIGLPLSSTGTTFAAAGTLALSSVSQINGTTLTAGTWAASGGATLQMPAGTSVVINQGTLSLTGAGSTITGIANVATNAGTFAVASGATFTTAGDLSNTGTLSMGAGGTLNVAGNLTESDAATLAYGLGGTSASNNFRQAQCRRDRRPRRHAVGDARRGVHAERQRQLHGRDLRQPHRHLQSLRLPDAELRHVLAADQPRQRDPDDQRHRAEQHDHGVAGDGKHAGVHCQLDRHPLPRRAGG